MKKKQRLEKRRRTDEELSRAADAKLERYIANSAIEWASREPDVRRQMVAQTFGYHIPNETEKRFSELVAYIDKRAIERLKEDDALVRTIVEARIRQVTGEMGLRIEGEKWRHKPLTMDDYIEQVKKVKELKEALGVKEPGLWSSLMDPQVISSILAIVREVFIQKQPSGEDNVLVMIQEGGINRLIPLEEYTKMTDKEPVAYIGDEEQSGAADEGEGNDLASELEIPDKTEERDGETGTASQSN